MTKNVLIVPCIACGKRTPLLFAKENRGLCRWCANPRNTCWKQVIERTYREAYALHHAGVFANG